MQRIAATPVLVAIACLVPVSSWWFIQLPNLLKQHSAAAGSLSLQALEATLLLQCLAVCLFTPFWTGRRQPMPQQPGILDQGIAALSFVAPAWPFLAILTLASEVTLSAMAVAEVAVFATGVVVASLVLQVRKLRLQAEAIRLVRLSVGAGAAALVWIFRADLLQWLL